MATVKTMTTAALATFNSLDRAVDFDSPAANTYKMKYNTKTQGFGNSNVTVGTVGVYAKVDRNSEITAGNSGQCVSFVKAMCDIATGTGTWVRGTQLSPTLSIAKGTAIATFTGPIDPKTGLPTYDGTNATGQAHTGIFLAFYTNLSTGEKGVEIFDQNWVGTGIAGIHRIPFKSSASGAKDDAGRYYIVTIGLSSSLQKFVWGTPHTFLNI